MLSEAQLAVREVLRKKTPQELSKLLLNERSRKELEDFEADCCLDDFETFLVTALSGSPGSEWECPALALAARLTNAPFISLVCSTLEDFSHGRVPECFKEGSPWNPGVPPNPHFLLINLPPGHLKSLIVAVLWQAWHWLREPVLQMAGINAVERVAARDARRLRALIQTPGYRKLVQRASVRTPIPSPFGTQWFGYPEWGMSKEQNEKVNFETSAGGKRLAVAYGAGIIGDRLAVALYDDTMGADDFIGTPDQVKAACESVKILFDEQFSSRFFRGQICTGQRLGEEDLPGHWIATRNPVVVCLPLRFESEHPLRHPLDHRKEGELLSKATIAATRPGGRADPEQAADDFEKELGDAAPGQLQQRPIGRGGSVFKKHWFEKFYSAPPDVMAGLCDEIGISADLGVRDKQSNDPTSVTIWGRRSNPLGIFLLGRINVRIEFFEQLRLIKTTRSALPRCHFVLIDERQTGPAVIAMLSEEIPGVIPFKDRNQSKVERAKATTPMWEQGRIFLPLPQYCPWIVDYVRQHLSFPKSKHDDDVDSTSQALLRWGADFGTEEEADGKTTLEALTLLYSGGVAGQGGQW